MGILFYILSLLLFTSTLILFTARFSAIKVILVQLFWIVYLVTLSSSEVLLKFNLPPRVPLLVVLPALLLILYIVSSEKNTFTTIPKHHIIYLQSFRIFVEILIYYSFLNGVFPELATFKGLNFDIIVGVSALVIGYLVKKNRLKVNGILIWNFASLAILSLTVFSFIYSYYFGGFTLTEDHKKFVEFPYLLLAGYLLPMAIFFHVVSISQCWTELRK